MTKCQLESDNGNVLYTLELPIGHVLILANVTVHQILQKPSEVCLRYGIPNAISFCMPCKLHPYGSLSCYGYFAAILNLVQPTPRVIDCFLLQNPLSPK